MKKRKIKLFASVASLAMVAAVMGVGVWAASSQNVSVNSTVNFTATSIAADVTLAISHAGAEDIIDYASDTKGNQTAKNYEGAGLQVATFTIEDQTETDAATVYINLQDANGDGYLTAGSQIIYTFTVNAAAGSADIFYKVTLPEAEGFTVTTANNGIGQITAQAKTIVVTYEVTENIASIAEVNGNFGQITIALKNKAFTAES